MNVDPQTRTADRLKLLESLLKSGVTLEDAAQKLNPRLVDQRELLRHLAFARQFRRDVVDLLAHRLNKPQALVVDEILATPGIEMVTVDVEPSNAIYRVKDALVGELLMEWVQRDPERGDIRAVAKSLWQHLQASTPGTLQDRLRYQIAGASNSTEQRDAETAFDTAFDAANVKPDLAQCHALIRMLTDLDNFTVGSVTVPLRLLSQTLKSRADELRPYVAVRGRFIEEHFRSSQYQQRDSLWNRVKPFLDGETGWLLSIFGTGGRGKTMFMQWLIARHCIRREHTIPIGRVDFDEIDAGKLENDPELLLLPLAEQLNRQLPEAPLQDIVDRWGRFAVILTPAARIPRGVSVDGLVHQYRSEVIPDVLIETFAFKLSTAGTAVLLLDTLEDALLHQPTALQRVVELCRKVHAAQPPQSNTLRIILSGRYNLQERGFLGPDDPIPVEVTAFEYDERVRYLTEKRQLPERNRDAMVDAIARKSDGNPFILSLVADLVEEGTVTSVEEVNELRAEFAYLLDRVIRRIPDSQGAVRWVIRYGVVPDRLTEDFLDKVMQPHLRRELAGGDSTRDTLAQYSHYFPRGGELDTRTLWRDLGAYASDYSWVRATADEIRFQPEVVVPMLALLSEEEGVYSLLHRDAERYFREKAEQDAERWVAWMAEAVYHKFQLGDADAEFAFRALLDDSRAQPATLRRQVLNVVTRPRFVDDEGSLRRKADKEPLVDARVVGWAYLELARLGAGIGFGPCRLVDPPSTVSRWLDRSQTLYGPPLFRVDTLVRMSIAAEHDRFEEVQALGGGLTDRDLASPEDQYACRILLARAAAHRNTPESIEQALHLLQQAEEVLPLHHPALEHLSEERAGLLASTNRHAETVSVLEKTVHMSSDGQMGHLCRLAELHLDRAEFARVVALLPNFNLHGLFDTPEGLRLARTRVLAALDRGDVLEDLPRGFDTAPEAAEVSEARGAWLLSSYQLASGIEMLERAVAGYRTRGDLPATSRALLRLIRARVDLVGDRVRAEQGLPDPFLLEPDMLSMFAIEAARLLSPESSTPPWPHPAGWAAAAIELMREDRAPTGRGEPYILELAEQLAALGPVSARYQSLRFFRWVDSSGRFGSRASGGAERLLAVVTPPDPADPDFLAHAVPYVECLRVCSGEEPARTMLVTTLRAAARRRHTAGCSLLRLSRRLGMTAPSWDTLGAPAGVLAIAVNVEYARSLLDAGDQKSAAEVLSIVPEPLPAELARSRTAAVHLENRARLLQGTASAAASDQAADIRRHLGYAVTHVARTPAASEVKTGAGTVLVSDLADPWPIAGTRELVPFEMVKALIEPEDVVKARLSGVLPDGLSSQELRLVMDQVRAASMLPWEWALADGVLGYRSIEPNKGSGSLGSVIWPRLPDQARRMLTFFRPIRILVAQPSVAEQERRRRGFERTSRRTLVDIYTSHGLKPTLAEGGLENITRGMEGEEIPQVVHLQCSIGEAYRQLYLELGSADGPEVTIDALTGAFPSPDKMRPTVILDPPRPADDLETARQLLLRNRFALDLFATGRVQAVLCTGLFEPATVQLSAERLAHAMAANPPIRDLLMFVQRDLDGDRFATRGAALFANDPLLAMA